MNPKSPLTENRESSLSGMNPTASDPVLDQLSEAILTEEEQEALYDNGYALYRQRKFAEATCVFVYLAMQNMFNARYVFALGACLQAQSALEAACQAYQMCRVLEPMNPLAAFHLGECQLQMGNRSDALKSYRDAVALSENLPEQLEWVARAKGLIDLIASATKV